QDLRVLLTRIIACRPKQFKREELPPVREPVRVSVRVSVSIVTLPKRAVLHTLGGRTGCDEQPVDDAQSLGGTTRVIAGRRVCPSSPGTSENEAAVESAPLPRQTCRQKAPRPHGKYQLDRAHERDRLQAGMSR